MQSVLYINKPQDITSFDICFRLRKVLKTKAIGHTGTLDPHATGVMIILFDKTCKAAPFLSSAKKEYIAKIKYGIATDTLDITGKIIERKEDYIKPSKAEISEVLKTFEGPSLQEVPITSAVKVKGKKLYEYQRQGQVVDLPIREIHIYRIGLLKMEEDGFTFICEVSAGTYIRSLCRDILKKLKIVGTLEELTRTRIDNIALADCDSLEAALKGDLHFHPLIDHLKEYYPLIDCDEKLVKDIKNGKRLLLNVDHEKIALVKDEEVLAIYAKDGIEYRCVRGLF